MRILIIEDEYTLADVISSRLQKEKYTVDISLDGEDGLYNALTGIYDLIILDVMLPKMNGFDVLKKIREENIKSKVIMLTAKAMIDDKLNGFENGANDYVTKPFNIDELVARVNVWTRQDGNTYTDYLEFGDIRLYKTTSKLKCMATMDEIDVILKEFLILEYFINNKDQVLSKEQIYNKVWGIDSEAESNNLEAYLSFIRRKLKVIGSNVNIKSLRRIGYKLEVSNEEIKK